jgi:hypothetical protein
MSHNHYSHEGQCPGPRGTPLRVRQDFVSRLVNAFCCVGGELGVRRFRRVFRFLLTLEDGKPNDPAVFVTAVPNWTVGEEFLLGKGKRLRILAIDTDISEELVDKEEAEPLLGGASLPPRWRWRPTPRVDGRNGSLLPPLQPPLQARSSDEFNDEPKSYAQRQFPL